MNQIDVRWIGGMAFETEAPTGVRFVMDSHPEFGGQKRGPTPVEALLASAAACSAIDVISVMEKKRQKVASYHIEVTWERGPEGVYPRPITSMRIRHILNGENLDPAAVAKAVQLSDEKYCSVLATLRIPVDVTTEHVIE